MHYQKRVLRDFFFKDRVSMSVSVTSLNDNSSHLFRFFFWWRGGGGPFCFSRLTQSSFFVGICVLVV